VVRHQCSALGEGEHEDEVEEELQRGDALLLAERGAEPGLARFGGRRHRRDLFKPSPLTIGSPSWIRAWAVVVAAAFALLGLALASRRTEAAVEHRRPAAGA
jgi:hypothetical protein